MKARICPIVKQVWLLPFMHCLYCFGISLTLQLTTWADTSLHLPKMSINIWAKNVPKNFQKSPNLVTLLVTLFENLLVCIMPVQNGSKLDVICVPSSRGYYSLTKSSVTPVLSPPTTFRSKKDNVNGRPNGLRLVQTTAILLRPATNAVCCN